ncbi:hypothetical protein HMPREF1317_0697 [Schaalia georgiae F0490]|uniref:Uncharacterized protein n=1 Tax=Schaalia georgiae F0490 TaxID=1125717 RepID=J1HZE3_9ACTO|nr:hypothetical protein HMPREF1317_0697 [Schaalia georgiae F0490]
MCGVVFPNPVPCVRHLEGVRGGPSGNGGSAPAGLGGAPQGNMKAL